MPSLTRDQLRSRLEFDFKIAMGMSCPLVSIAAYPTAMSLEHQKHPVTEVEKAWQVSHYRVEYHIKSLVGKGKYHDHFIVSIDLQANGNYPYSEPACFVISQPLPWTPHFAPNLPICLGELWRDMEGQATVGHLALHIAKLLNFDEPERTPGYRGYNGEAVDFWKRELAGKPITPNLVYPTLPPELTHGRAVTSAALFKRATGGSSLFKPHASAQLFRREG